MIKYVLGFMFNEKETDVLLIQKAKPEWQAGKFNGLGGKREIYQRIIGAKGIYSKRLPDHLLESSEDAMSREFKEETGIDSLPNVWSPVVTMSGDGWLVDVFTCKSDMVFYYKQMEEEKVYLIPIEELDRYDCISNLRWLIPMCLDKNNINYKISTP